MAKANVNRQISTFHLGDKPNDTTEKAFSLLGLLWVLVAQIYLVKWAMITNFQGFKA
jgi:hypothetical protein